MKKLLTFVFLYTHLSLTGALLTLPAQEWSSWRGPNADGTVTGTPWNPKALDRGAKIAWRVNVGEGYSAVSIRGRFLYTMGNNGSQDSIYCLDVRTGKEIWKYSYSASRGSYPGPRTTPVLDGNNLYSLSRYGDFISLNAANGRLNWKKNITREHGVSAPGWGFSTSAVIHGSLVILNAGRAGMAFDKNTGNLVWTNGGGQGGYATPTLLTMGGVTYAAMFSLTSLFLVEAETGKEMWSYPWRTSNNVNAADPIASGNRIFISSGYGRGATLLAITTRGASKVWESNVMENHFSSSVLKDGYLYGISGQAGQGRSALKCIEMETGKERWSTNTGMGSLIAVDDKLIILNEQGTLTIADADPNRYRQISSVSGVVNRLAWTPPVFSEGMLYLRNDRGDLICIDMR